MDFRRGAIKNKPSWLGQTLELFGINNYYLNRENKSTFILLFLRENLRFPPKVRLSLFPSAKNKR